MLRTLTCSNSATGQPWLTGAVWVLAALAVPADHPLARRPTLRLAEAAGERFASTIPGYGVRTLLDNAAAEAGFVPCADEGIRQMLR